MSSDLMLDFINHQQYPGMDSEAAITSIDQGGEEWDISLFDELDDLGDADELLEALQSAAYVSHFSFTDQVWSLDVFVFADGDVSEDSLSPAHTFSSVPSPSSVEAPSPYSSQDEALSPQQQPSPVSVCSDSSGFSKVSPPPKKVPRRTTKTTQAQPLKRPIQTGPKISIQPKPIITTVPLATTPAALQPKTIIIQPLQTTVLPVVKQTPVSIQPAPPSGPSIVLSQPSQLLQIQTPQAITGGVVAMPTLSQDRPVSVSAPPLVSVQLRSPSSDDDLSQRQQRMIKNRESASLSRKKKKEYLMSLEARLKLALSENAVLKSENGSLKKQLEGLLSENTVLKATAPKRRAVCLMVVLVFLVLNVGPTSLLQGGPDSSLEVAPMQPSGRHLLGFSSEYLVSDNNCHFTHSLFAFFSSSSAGGKALMVVKDPVFLRPPPPCQPSINRTKCIQLAHELSGWVHRHEVEQTKSRRMSSSPHRPTRTTLVSHNHKQINPIIRVAEKMSELQLYYAPKHVYSDFFEELNRQADTFYVVSFRRPTLTYSLLLLGSTDSIIGGKDFQVMMQIDCEVTDTRILHIRSSSIPPVLRVNDTFYQHSSTDSKATPPVGVLMGSA
uniref:Activating transcription factor 6 n=1 Tax=Oryzias melastigma TaxID=30732 RepID=A0A3B3D8K1_ORYME